MKATWEHPKEQKERPKLWGLYKPKGHNLICYFMAEREARSTARHLGDGFKVKRISRK